MGREIRRVPANWEHPQYARHNLGYEWSMTYRPMYQWSYEEAVQDYKNLIAEFKEAYHLYKNGFAKYKNNNVSIKEFCKKYIAEHLADEDDKIFYKEDWLNMHYGAESGILDMQYICELPKYPDPQDYMPKGEWYQLYEDVSAGTPLSPPFETAEQLIDWLSNNLDYRGTQWSKEAAANILKDGFAFSMVVTNGEIYAPEQQHLIKNKDTQNV